MPSGARQLTAQEMARRVLVSSLVLLLLVILALAVWKIRLVILLFLLAVVIASAMRPGVEALWQRGIPRGVGIAVHYAALAAVVAVLLLKEIGAHQMKARLQAYSSHASEEKTGLGIALMDPRIGTRFPSSLKEAVTLVGEQL